MSDEMKRLVARRRGLKNEHLVTIQMQERFETRYPSFEWARIAIENRITELNYLKTMNEVAITNLERQEAAARKQAGVENRRKAMERKKLVTA